jgi:hypothetical protein
MLWLYHDVSSYARPSVMLLAAGRRDRPTTEQADRLERVSSSGGSSIVAARAPGPGEDHPLGFPVPLP